VEFFLVPIERGQVPVWVFKPVDAVEAVAGLVMNLSDGGVQVLTGASGSLERGAHEIQLLLGEGESVPRFRGGVTHVWTREADGLGWLSGLRFDQASSPAEDFLRGYRAAGQDAPSRRWVRRLLLPRPAASSRPPAPLAQPQDTNTI
jgi:hypothetical protein